MADMIKVYNDRHYDYGVRTLQGIEKNIKPGSFVLLTEEDILYIESQCSPGKKPFATGLLRAVMPQKEKTIESIGIEKDVKKEYLKKDEIASRLKGRVATLKAWLNEIEEPDYLHEIYLVAKDIDLPATKIRMLKEKMPNKTFIDDDE